MFVAPNCCVKWVGPRFSLCSGWEIGQSGIHQCRVLSALFVGKPAPEYSLQEESRFLQPFRLLSIALPSAKGGLSPPCRTLGLEYPICGSVHSLPRGRVGSWRPPLAFRSLSGVEALMLCLLFFFCPSRLHEYLTCSFGCIGVLPVYSLFPMRIFAHIDVFLMRL